MKYHWLTEWHDASMNISSKRQYAYAKAINSLKKYPLPLSSGKEAKILEGFGDKICKMLDKKLIEHGITPGTPISCKYQPMEVDKHSRVTDQCEESDEYSSRTQNRTKENNSRRVQSEQPGGRCQKTSRGNVGSKREYIPAYRSGPYALILALYNDMQKENSRGYLTKGELMQEAQPLCEKSFSRPDPGCRYTAWSSMGTLIKKGLIVKDSSPAKYSLTDSGCMLADRLQSVVTAPSSSVANPSFTVTSSSRLPDHTSTDESGKSCYSQDKDQDMIDDSSCHTGTQSYEDMRQDKMTKKLEYWYVDDDGNDVQYKDKAAILIDDDIDIGFLVKCRKSSLVESNLHYKLDSTRSGSSLYVYAYLHNDACDETCPLSISTGTASLSSVSTTFDLRPDSQHSIASSQISRMSDDTTTTSSSSSSLSLPCRDYKAEFIFTPGNFDIVLCVDNCETAGGAGSMKKTLLPELKKNGVNCEVRKLQVGDFLWVAKERIQPKPGQLQMPVARELVLDYIIERKRMDDLASSIMDGRFKEQKFRLKNCGLRKPIYLVEDFGCSQHLSIPEATLHQAIVNTQVIDGFHIKHTHELKESVAYVTVMTRYLQSLYLDKALSCCRKEDIETQQSVSTGHNVLMTFTEFNESAVKNKAMTVTEMFAKQLMQVSGLSAEKAKSILEKYRTPKQLIAAYDDCYSTEQREKLLSCLKYGKTKRNIGPALSRAVHQLYNTYGALQ
ncbi:structure-specific endonuclease subunit MUS81-like isoform X2 [Glandiceps talaboti]